MSDRVKVSEVCSATYTAKLEIDLATRIALRNLCSLTEEVRGDSKVRIQELLWELNQALPD